MSKVNNKLFFVLFLITCFIFSCFMINKLFTRFNHLEIINYEKKIDKNITKAYNDRGAYILNDIYLLNSNTKIISNLDSLPMRDSAISRPKDYVFKPKISDIKAPFKIFKNNNNDTLFIEKYGREIILVLDID